MKVNLELFSDALSSVVTGVGFGTSNPANFFEVFQKDDCSYLSTSNNFFTNILKLPFTFPKCKLRAVELLQVVKLLENDVFDIELTDSGLEIVDGDNKYTVSTMNTTVSPYQLISMPDTFDNLEESFWSGLDYVYNNSVTKWNCQSLLEFIYVDGTTMCFTNGVKIIKYTLDVKYPKMFVKRDFCKDLLKGSYNQFHRDDSFIYFLNSDKQLLTAIRTLPVSQKYPVMITKSDYTDAEWEAKKGKTLDALFSPSEDSISFSFDTVHDQVMGILRSSKIFTSSSNNVEAVLIEYDGSHLKFSARGAFGSMNRKIAFTECTTPFKFSINPNFLLESIADNSKYTLSKGKLSVTSDTCGVLIALTT